LGLCWLATSFACFGQDSLPDPGRATGAEIEAYRRQAIPTEYPSPARYWYYSDVAVIAALLCSGMWMARTRKPARWISAQLAVSLLYLGIYRGGCICPVGATANVFLGLQRPALVGLATLALFMIPLVMALIGGRVFCGAVCPLGALQHLIAPKKARKLPRLLHRTLLALPILILIGTAAKVWTGRGFLPCQIDPYTPVFFQGHALIQKLGSCLGLGYAEPRWIGAGSVTAWGLLAGALALGWVIPRVFCRYVCPYGVLLGLLAAVGFWRRQIDPDSCVQCNRCAKECPVQAIGPSGDGLALSSYQCVQCGRCSEVCKRQSL
jgi:polyferredoxin